METTQGVRVFLTVLVVTMRMANANNPRFVPGFVHPVRKARLQPSPRRVDIVDTIFPAWFYGSHHPEGGRRRLPPGNAVDVSRFAPGPDRFPLLSSAFTSGRNGSSDATTITTVRLDCHGLDNTEATSYAHPSRCKSWYQCRDGLAKVRSCPGVLVFNAVLQNCDWPHNVDCDHGNLPVVREATTIQTFTNHWERETVPSRDTSSRRSNDRNTSSSSEGISGRSIISIAGLGIGVAVVMIVVILAVVVYRRKKREAAAVSSSRLAGRSPDGTVLVSTVQTTPSIDAAAAAEVTVDASPDDADETLTCLVCFDRRRDVILQPCGHLVLCGSCAKTQVQTGNYLCVMCRQPVHRIQKVFM